MTLFLTPWPRTAANCLLSTVLLHAGAALADDSGPAPAAAEAGPPAQRVALASPGPAGRGAPVTLARITVEGRDPGAVERAVAAAAALRSGSAADDAVPVVVEADDEPTAATVVDRLWAAGLGGQYLVRAYPRPAAAAALKRSYLACEEAAMQQPLDAGTAMHCSQVYEAVLRGVFRGRHDDLFAWWKDAAPMP